MREAGSIGHSRLCNSSSHKWVQGVVGGTKSVPTFFIVVRVAGNVGKASEASVIETKLSSLPVKEVR